MVGQKRIQYKAGGQARHVGLLTGQTGVQQDREEGEVGDQSEQVTGLRAAELAQHAGERAHAPVAPRHMAMQHEGEQAAGLVRERPCRVRRDARADGRVEDGDVGEPADGAGPSIRADPPPWQRRPRIRAHVAPLVSSSH